MNFQDIISLQEAYFDVYGEDSYVQEDFRELSDPKRELVDRKMKQLASEITGIQGEVQRQANRPFARFRPGVKRRITDLVISAGKKAKLFKNANTALTRTIDARLGRKSKQIEALNKRLPHNNIVPLRREDYEAVISYLVDEGYADSIDSALCIFENMSQEWIESVVYLNY